MKILTAKKLVKLLKADGWYEKNQEGSHLHFVHPEKRGKITVPMHDDDLNIKTCNTILKQAGLK